MIKLFKLILYIILIGIIVENTNINVKYNYNLPLRLKKNFTRSIEEIIIYNKSLHLK
jgi:hypothetical protein